MGKITIIAKVLAGTTVVASLSVAHASNMSDLDLVVRFSVSQNLTTVLGQLVNEEDVECLKITEADATHVVVTSEVPRSGHRYYCATLIARNANGSLGLDQTRCHE